MFDVEKIAKTIKEKRIEKNMTQLALADYMGVSYQAVSNWERGNSMPDISKLEDLCRILDVTVEELLGMESFGTKAVEKIMKNSDDISIEEIAEVAPILPPETIKEKTEKGRRKINFRALSGIIEYLDDDYIGKLVSEVLDSAENALNKAEGLFDIIEYLPDDSVMEIIEKAGPEDMKSLADCLEDFDDDAADLFAEKCIKFGRIDIITENAEFFSDEALEKFVDYCIDKKFFRKL